MSVANRLVESGHYASQQIKQIANQLEQEWKAFAAALDERSTLLDMSSIFHQKAEKVSPRAPRPMGWCQEDFLLRYPPKSLEDFCVTLIVPKNMSSQARHLGVKTQLSYLVLCNLRQVTSPLCSLVFSFVKWN